MSENRSLTHGELQDIEALFVYHQPVEEQIECLKMVREAAMEFAKVLYSNTPPCADRSAAIRHLRECVMTANAAIILNG